MRKTKFLSLLFLLGVTLISCKPEGGDSQTSVPNGEQSQTSVTNSEEESSSSETRYPVDQKSYDQPFKDFDVTNETSTNLGVGGATWVTTDVYLGTYEEGTSGQVDVTSLVLKGGVVPSSVTITFPNGLDYLAFETYEVVHINKDRDYRFDVTHAGTTKTYTFAENIMVAVNPNDDLTRHLMQSTWGAHEGEVIVKFYAVGGPNQDLAINSFTWMDYILA